MILVYPLPWAGAKEFINLKPQNPYIAADQTTLALVPVKSEGLTLALQQLLGKHRVSYYVHFVAYPGPDLDMWRPLGLTSHP